MDWLHGRGLEFYLESNNGLFASERFEERARSVIIEYMGRKGRDTANMTVRSVFPDMIFGGELYRGDVNKVSFVLDSYRDYMDSIEEFPDLLPGTCHLPNQPPFLYGAVTAGARGKKKQWTNVDSFCIVSTIPANRPVLCMRSYPYKVGQIT